MQLHRPDCMYSCTLYTVQGRAALCYSTVGDWQNNTYLVGGGITGASGLEPDKYSLRALHILLYMVRDWQNNTVT